jgi:hypothetical protein
MSFKKKHVIPKKTKIQDFMGKIISFFGTLSFNSAILATWLNLGAPQFRKMSLKYMKNEIIHNF